MTSKIYSSTYDKNKTLKGEAACRNKQSLTFQKIKKIIADMIIWLRRGHLKREAEFLLMVVQNKFLFIKTYFNKATIKKIQQNNE